MELLRGTAPLILDGATGMNLQKAGMPAGVCPEQWILENPQVLAALQQAFVDAGSKLVYAPTFGANRVKLKKYGLEAELAEINRKLVALSRSAVGTSAAVGGDMTSLGLFIEPFGSASFDEVVEIYREQALALEEAGVDFFIVETIMQLFEARAALLAIRSVSQKPVFITVTLEQNGRMLGGTDPLAALTVLQAMGVDAFGINCSHGPTEILRQIQRLAPFAEVPLIAKPNAGIPCADADGCVHYHMTPDAFSADTAKFVEAGVCLLGGCCGTEPAHIAALARSAANLTCKPFGQREIALPASDKDAFIDAALPSSPKAMNESGNLADAIFDLDADENETVCLAIHTEADLAEFVENQYLLRNPLCLIAQDAALAACALRIYQGRAYLSLPDTAAAEALARTYGAIVL